MNKKSKILAVVICFFIFLVLILIGLKPIVLRAFKPQEKKDNVEESIKDEVEPLLTANNIILGINIMYEGEGITLQNNNLKIEKGGTYNITGELPNGKIIIDAPQKVTLNFNNVKLFNAEAEIIDITSENDVTLNITGNNDFVTNGNMAIKSIADLNFTGTGNLNITSAGIGLQAAKITFSTLKVVIKTGSNIFTNETNFLISGGEFIALGRDGYGHIVTENSQETSIFKIPFNLSREDRIILKDLDNQEIVNITGFDQSNMLILSNKNYHNTHFTLWKNEEKIIINNMEDYYFAKTLNIFG